MPGTVRYSSLVAACVAGLSAAASAEFVLDLDPREGDQNVREMQVRPGDLLDLELVALSGAQDLEGFDVQLRFEPDHFEYASFQPDGLMSGTDALPLQKTDDGVRISAGTPDHRSPEDAGSLGRIRIQITSSFSGAGNISLVGGTLIAGGQTHEFPFNSTVRLSTGEAEGLAASPDPNPEEIIDTLPEELQSLYREALEFTERADPSTESESLDHRILALEETRSYTATATLEEKRQIALALLFFHFGGDDEDPEKKKLKMEMQEAQDPTAELLALLERLLEKNHHLSMQVLRRAQ